MTGAKLSRQYRPTSYYRDVCRPKTFPEAFTDFKHFFHDKTQIQWDERLEGIKKDGAFVYTPPILGRPVGDVPVGYVRPEYRDDEVVYDTDSEVGDDDDETEESEDGVRVKSDSDASTTTVTSGEETSTDASTDECDVVLQPQIYPNVSDGYGYQPSVVDARFVSSYDEVSEDLNSLTDQTFFSFTSDEEVPSTDLSQTVSQASSFTIYGDSHSIHNLNSQDCEQAPISQQSSEKTLTQQSLPETQHIFSQIDLTSL